MWTPLYLASPGGRALAPIIVDVAALIAGGLGGMHAGPTGAAQHLQLISINPLLTRAANFETVGLTPILDTQGNSGDTSP